MYLFNKLGLDAYYGYITSTMLSHIIAIIILMYNFKKQTKISYKDTFKIGTKIILSVLIMLVCLSTLKLFIPINIDSRISAILICALYAIVGGIIYLYIIYKFGIVDKIIGNDNIRKYLKKFKK